jgi:hypothetical protein
VQGFRVGGVREGSPFLRLAAKSRFFWRYAGAEAVFPAKMLIPQGLQIKYSKREELAAGIAPSAGEWDPLSRSEAIRHEACAPSLCSIKMLDQDCPSHQETNVLDQKGGEPRKTGMGGMASARSQGRNSPGRFFPSFVVAVRSHPLSTWAAERRCIRVPPHAHTLPAWFAHTLAGIAGAFTHHHAAILLHRCVLPVLDSATSRRSNPMRTACAANANGFLLCLLIENSRQKSAQTRHGHDAFSTDFGHVWLLTPSTLRSYRLQS